MRKAQNNMPIITLEEAKRLSDKKIPELKAQLEKSISEKIKTAAEHGLYEAIIYSLPQCVVNQHDTHPPNTMRPTDFFANIIKDLASYEQEVLNDLITGGFALAIKSGHIYASWQE